MLQAYAAMSIPSDLRQFNISEAFSADMLPMYCICFVALILYVLAVFRSRGVAFCIWILVYLAAGSTITISVKNVYVNHAFEYPKLLTSMHFMSSAALGFTIMLYHKCAASKKIAVPTPNQFFFMIVPIALAGASSIAANNMALVYSNVAFNQMIQCAGPIVVAVTAVLMGKPLPLSLVPPLMLVCGGLVFCISGELKLSWVGLGLVGYSLVARSVRTVLEQVVMEPSHDGVTPLNPAQLMAWMSLPSFAAMFLWSICTEGITPFAALVGENWASVWGGILLSCINAGILNLSILWMVSDLGAVFMQTASNLNNVLVILGGMVVFGDSLTFLQCFGNAVILAGISWYNHVDQSSKKASNPSDQPASESEPLRKSEPNLSRAVQV